LSELNNYFIIFLFEVLIGFARINIVNQAKNIATMLKKFKLLQYSLLFKHNSVNFNFALIFCILKGRVVLEQKIVLGVLYFYYPFR